MIIFFLVVLDKLFAKYLSPTTFILVGVYLWSFTSSVMLIGNKMETVMVMLYLIIHCIQKFLSQLPLFSQLVIHCLQNHCCVCLESLSFRDCYFVLLGFVFLLIACCSGLFLFIPHLLCLYLPCDL